MYLETVEGNSVKFIKIFIHIILLFQLNFLHDFHILVLSQQYNFVNIQKIFNVTKFVNKN